MNQEPQVINPRSGMRTAGILAIDATLAGIILFSAYVFVQQVMALRDEYRVMNNGHRMDELRQNYELYRGSPDGLAIKQEMLELQQANRNIKGND